MDKIDYLEALTAYSKNPTAEVPVILEQYLNGVANNGETMFQWPLLKPLILGKLKQVIEDLAKGLASETIPERPNMENVSFDVMHDRILEAIHRFNGAPFTIQRLCELLIDPRRHYMRSDKYLRGLEKNVLVVSTVDPYGRKVVSESRGKHLVNGLDTVSFPFGPRDSNISSILPPVPSWVQTAASSPQRAAVVDPADQKETQFTMETDEATETVAYDEEEDNLRGDNSASSSSSSSEELSAPDISDSTDVATCVVRAGTSHNLWPSVGRDRQTLARSGADHSSDTPGKSEALVPDPKTLPADEDGQAEGREQPSICGPSLNDSIGFETALKPGAMVGRADSTDDDSHSWSESGDSTVVKPESQSGHSSCVGLQHESGDSNSCRQKSECVDTNYGKQERENCDSVGTKQEPESVESINARPETESVDSKDESVDSKDVRPEHESVDSKDVEIESSNSRTITDPESVDSIVRPETESVDSNVKPETEGVDSIVRPETESVDSKDVTPETESVDSKDVTPEARSVDSNSRSETESVDSNEVEMESCNSLARTDPESVDSTDVRPETKSVDSNEVRPETESVDSNEVRPETESVDSRPETECIDSNELELEPDSANYDCVRTDPESVVTDSEVAVSDKGVVSKVAPLSQTSSSFILSSSEATASATKEKESIMPIDSTVKCHYEGNLEEPSTSSTQPLPPAPKRNVHSPADSSPSPTAPRRDVQTPADSSPSSPPAPRRDVQTPADSSPSSPPAPRRDVQTPADSSPSSPTAPSGDVQTPADSSPSSPTAPSGDVQTPADSSPSSPPAPSGDVQTPADSSPSSPPAPRRDVQTPADSSPSSPPAPSGDVQTPADSSPSSPPAPRRDVQTPADSSPSSPPAPRRDVQTSADSSPSSPPAPRRDVQTPADSSPSSPPAPSEDVQTPADSSPSSPPAPKRNVHSPADSSPSSPPAPKRNVHSPADSSPSSPDEPQSKRRKLADESYSPPISSCSSDAVTTSSSSHSKFLSDHTHPTPNIEADTTSDYSSKHTTDSPTSQYSDVHNFMDVVSCSDDSEFGTPAQEDCNHSQRGAVSPPGQLSSSSDSLGFDISYNLNRVNPQDSQVTGSVSDEVQPQDNAEGIQLNSQEAEPMSDD